MFWPEPLVAIVCTAEQREKEQRPERAVPCGIESLLAGVPVLALE